MSKTWSPQFLDGADFPGGSAVQLSAGAFYVLTLQYPARQTGGSQRHLLSTNQP